MFLPPTLYAVILYCPDCRSYLHPPRTWVRVSTEPHSKRIKLKLRVQREALHGAILEQFRLVELTVHDRLCDACSRAQPSPDQWTASVQLRQHVPNRRTFFYLEQLILRHGAASRAVRISETDRGVDFFFGSRSHAVRFVEFLGDVSPVRSSTSKQLVSHDIKSNVYNYKHNFSVEICPICRDDLICLPSKVSHALGNLGPLVVCTKVSNAIALTDPFTLRTAFLDANQYWRAPFKPLLSSRQLIQYIVLDIQPESMEVTVAGSKHVLAHAQVARSSDFGKNNNIFTIKTHLGHLLSPGDHALGYDLYGANSNDIEVDKYKGLVIPKAILIKKSYEEKLRGKARPWKLKSLNMEVDSTSRGRIDEDRRNTEYEEFLRDLEENPELRFDISLYCNKEYQPSEIASTVGGDDLPSLLLEELLDELDLSSGEDYDDDSANGMVE